MPFYFSNLILQLALLQILISGITTIYWRNEEKRVMMLSESKEVLLSPSFLLITYTTLSFFPLIKKTR